MTTIEYSTFKGCMRHISLNMKWGTAQRVSRRLTNSLLVVTPSVSTSPPRRVNRVSAPLPLALNTSSKRGLLQGARRPIGVTLAITPRWRGAHPKSLNDESRAGWDSSLFPLPTRGAWSHHGVVVCASRCLFVHSPPGR